MPGEIVESALFFYLQRNQLLMFLEYIFLRMQLPQPKIVLSHKKKWFWFQRVERDTLNCYTLHTSWVDQFFLPVVEYDDKCALRTIQETGNCFFGSINCQFFNFSFHPCAHSSQPVFIRLKCNNRCKFLLRVTWFCKIQFSRYSVRYVDGSSIFIKLFPFFFKLLFFRYSVDRSYIIEVVGVGIEILRFIGKIFDHNDASHHEGHVFLTHHLKLVEDWIGIDAESSVKFDINHWL